MMLHALVVATALLAADPAGNDLPLEHSWTVGLEAWRQGSGIREVHAVGDLLLVEDAHHGITALERATGTARWVVQLDGPLAETPGFAVKKVTLATHDRVVVVDEGTGTRLFERELAAETAAAPVAGRSLLYEPSLLKSTLFARRMDGGQLAWRYRIQSDFTGQALYVPEIEESILVAPCTDGKIRAIPATHDMPAALRWTLDVGLPIGLMVQQGGTLYLSSDRRAVLAIDVSSGSVQWKSGVGAKPVAGPILVEDLVLVGTSDGLVALRQENGLQVWRESGAEVPLAAVPGLVVVRRPSGRILGRRTSDGSALEVPVGERVLGSGAYLVDWSDRRRVAVARSTAVPAGSVH